MADRFPTEIWEKILEEACEGGPFTSCSLSLVSKSFRAVSDPFRIVSVNLSTRKQLQSFLVFLVSRPIHRRNVRNLFVELHREMPYHWSYHHTSLWNARVAFTLAAQSERRNAWHGMTAFLKILEVIAESLVTLVLLLPYGAQFPHGGPLLPRVKPVVFSGTARMLDAFIGHKGSESRVPALEKLVLFGLRDYASVMQPLAARGQMPSLKLLGILELSPFALDDDDNNDIHHCTTTITGYLRSIFYGTSSIENTILQHVIFVEGHDQAVFGPPEDSIPSDIATEFSENLEAHIEHQITLDLVLQWRVIVGLTDISNEPPFKYWESMFSVVRSRWADEPDSGRGRWITGEPWGTPEPYEVF